MITEISKGFQLTIPAEWRHFLNITKGSKVEIKLNKRNKQVIIEPIQEKSCLKIMFKKADKLKPHKFTIDDLEKMEKDIYE